MGKSTSKGKKKDIASKPSKAKHAAARTTGALTKSSKKAGVSSVVAKRKPRSVTPPPLSIDVRKIFCVGGLPSRRDDWNLGPYLEQTLEALIKDESPNNKHNYVYLSTEPHMQGGKVVLVPHAVIIQCGCVPTTLLAMTTVQSETEDFSTFEDLNARWLPIHPKVSILKCETHMDGWLCEKLLLYSLLPSQVDAEEPAPVDSVSINWHEKELTWLVDEESAEECIDTELSDVPDEDKAIIKDRLCQKKDEEVDRREKVVDEKKALFRAMMQQERMLTEDLEGRRVFKVYPQDSRLDPVVLNGFGTMQHQNGFEKNTYVNRYIGNAERFF